MTNKALEDALTTARAKFGDSWVNTFCAKFGGMTALKLLDDRAAVALQELAQHGIHTDAPTPATIDDFDIWNRWNKRKATDNVRDEMRALNQITIESDNAKNV